MTNAVLKTLVFIAALVPVARLIVAALTGGSLTPNPIEYITHQTGWYALSFLTASLAVTPVRRLTGLAAIARFRRMLGLFAFFYATLHLLIWFCLDRFFDYSTIFADIAKRPFITIGMTTFLLLLPLALTSTARSIRRLGGKRWRQLHSLAYVAAVTGVVHFWWLVKSDIRQPQRFAIVIGLLLGLRVWWAYQGRSAPAVVR